MKITRLILFISVTICLTACFDRPDYGCPGCTTMVMFSADISKYSTRVTQDGNGWSTGDLIGTYMVDPGSDEVIDGAANIRYSCNLGSASSADFSSTSPHILPKDGTPAYFRAYYPYSTAIVNNDYPIRLADQSGGTTEHDLMYASTKEAYTADGDGDVTLNFAHQLTKVIFRFINNKNQTVYANNVAINGMSTSASFNVLEGRISKVFNNTRIWTCENQLAGEYEAIILPCEITSAQTLTCYVENEQFTWNFTATENDLSQFVPGYIYTITIPLDTESIGKAQVEVEGGTTGEPWASGGSTGGMATTMKYKLFPMDTNAFLDTELALTFENMSAVPKIGTSGNIRIYRATDDVLVDEIKMGDKNTPIDGIVALNTKMDVIGVTARGNSKPYRRVVNYRPVRIENNRVIIKPHSGKLEYNTSYYVVMDKEVLIHPDFSGISGKGKWAFTTKQELALPTDKDHTVIVSHDGNSDFYTIQGAIDFLVRNFGQDEQKTVYVRNGTYEELLFVSDTKMLTIEGESRGGVLIQYNNNNNFNPGVGSPVTDITKDTEMGTSISTSGGRCVFLINGMEKVYLKNLIVKNTSGNNGQAETIALTYGKATKCIDCEFHGFQDTLYTGDEYCFFYNCLITGGTDYIWGGVKVGLFEKCELRMVTSGAGIVQPRVNENELGFLMLDCKLTTPEPNSDYVTYLVRSFGMGDNVTYARCTMYDSFFTGGWTSTVPKPISSLNKGFRSYKNLDIHGSIREIAYSENAYELSDEEFNTYYGSRSILLNGYDNNGGTWFCEGIN